MSDSFKRLDQTDRHAPVHAFLLCAGIGFVVAVVCTVVSAPFDFRMVIAFLIGAVIICGACSAMFALPPSLFRCQSWLSLELVSLLPLKFSIGFGWVTIVFMVVAVFVSIIAVLSTFQVLLQVFFPPAWSQAE